MCHEKPADSSSAEPRPLNHRAISGVEASGQPFQRDDQPFAQQRAVFVGQVGGQRDEDFRFRAARQGHAGAESLSRLLSSRTMPRRVRRTSPKSDEVSRVLLPSSLFFLPRGDGYKKSRGRPAVPAALQARTLGGSTRDHRRHWFCEASRTKSARSSARIWATRGAQGADGGGDVVDRHFFHELVAQVGDGGERGRLGQQHRAQHEQDEAGAQRARQQGARRDHGENR